MDPIIPTADAIIGQPHDIAFALVVLMTLVSIIIAWYSRRWTRTTAEFYVAGHSIPWIQNALALTGDYLSAASFLGVAGAIAIFGIDRMWDALGYFGGYVVLLILLAAPLRNVGKYTVADVLDERFNWKPLRALAMIGTVIICAFYLIPQMVGSGWLLNVLLGWDYVFAEVVIGALMVIYVVLGGMRGTTYNQIIQAIVLWLAMFLIMVLTLSMFFGGSPLNLFQVVSRVVPPAAAVKVLDQLGISSTELLKLGVPSAKAKEIAEAIYIAVRNFFPEGALTPGAFAKDPMNTFSFAMGIVLGTSGLPHVLMRYYTVPSARDARMSTVGVLFAIGTFYIWASIVGFAAMAILYPYLVGWLATGKAGLAKNMPVPLMAYVAGGGISGEALMGIAAAGAFAAILSTVAGLLITATASISYDLYTKLVKPHASEKEQLLVAKISAIILGAIAVLLGIALRGQNVSYLVTLAFGIAASSFFPVLALAVWWKRLTKEGALAGMLAGLTVSVIFVAAKLAGLKSLAGIPVLVNPALYSVTAAFLAAIIVSLVTRDTGKVDEFMARAHGVMR